MLTRDSVQKSSSRRSPLEFDAIVDKRSNACVFDCCRKFSLHSIQPTEKTTTVSEKCSSKPSANGVPIMTIAAVANTAANCSVILLFHNIAHAESNDTKILLSSDQMKKGGVDCKSIDLNQRWKGKTRMVSLVTNVCRRTATKFPSNVGKQNSAKKTANVSHTHNCHHQRRPN